MEGSLTGVIVRLGTLTASGSRPASRAGRRALGVCPDAGWRLLSLSPGSPACAARPSTQLASFRDFGATARIRGTKRWDTSAYNKLFPGAFRRGLNARRPCSRVCRGRGR
jgi:hypothetical protein